MRADVEQIRVMIDRTIDGKSNVQLRRTTEGKWNSAQVLDHLARSYLLTARGLATAAGSGEPQKFAPLKPFIRIARILVLGIGKIPKGRTPPDGTVPAGDDLEPTQAKNHVLKNLERLSAALDEAERKFGPNKKVAAHPVLGPMSVAQWARFHFVHTRHHMRHIRKRTGP